MGVRLVYTLRGLTVFFYLMGGGYAHGQAFIGPIAQGMGGAGRAAAEVGEAVLMNPASLVHAPDYSVGTYYLNGSPTPGHSEEIFGVIATDNHKGVIFPGAIAYFQNKKTFLDLPEIKEKIIQASLGRFLVRQFAVGATVYYVTQTQKGQKDHSQWNSTLGVHWNPSRRLGLGLVYYHFLDSNSPDHFKLPQAWGVGTTYIFSEFLKFKLDLTYPLHLNPNQRFTYHGGIESAFSKYFSFRMGGEINEVTQNDSYALGITFNALRWLLDYSIKIHPQNKDTMHGVDLRVFL